MYHKSQSYDVCFLRCGVRQTCFVILGHFLPFYPINNLKNQNFENTKKMPGDVIILQLYSTNDNHMTYGSWDMECNRNNFLSFWTIFCPFNPLTNQIISFEKMKLNAWRYHHFTQAYHEWQPYDVWFLKRDRQNFLQILAIFCYFTPPTTQKIKILIKWKKDDICILSFFLLFHPLTSQKIKI